MLVLVSIHSDDYPNRTTTFLIYDSCHLYPFSVIALWLGERTGLRWGVRPGSYKVTARLAKGTSGATSTRVDRSG